MKKQFFILAILLALPSFVSAQELRTPFSVKVDGADIEANPNYTGPVLVDWNRDGIQDLVVSTFRGDFRFYKNHGSNAEAMFLAELAPSVP